MRAICPVDNNACIPPATGAGIGREAPHGKTRITDTLDSLSTAANTKASSSRTRGAACYTVIAGYEGFCCVVTIFTPHMCLRLLLRSGLLFPPTRGGSSDLTFSCAILVNPPAFSILTASPASTARRHHAKYAVFFWPLESGVDRLHPMGKAEPLNKSLQPRPTCSSRPIDA